MRVVSLVPSLTKTLFDLGMTANEVIGRTPWCIHPHGLVDDVEFVGGTKNPRIEKIRALKPDLIVMDKEENPLKVFQTLSAEGFNIFVSEVEAPEDVPQMLRDLGQACGRTSAGEQLALLCEDSLNQIIPSVQSPRTLPLIWHKPLMAVSPRRYSGAILSLVGFQVIDTHPDSNGYPEISIDDFISNRIELILLTSEPHKFTMAEGQAIVDSIVAAGGDPPQVCLIDGEDLTWFGSTTGPAIARLRDFRQQLKGAN